MVKAILIGAGLRGCETYASYALRYPNEFKIVAVAEPDKERREKAARLHQIPVERTFSDYKPLLELEKMADCALVCTQDKMHYEPVAKAIQKGYHVLCEKPMSSDREEIIKMGAIAQKYDRILSICHVLRYSSFFTKIKGLLEEGRIGRLMSVQHIEEVGFWHQAHSFVRGNWRNSDETSPMILAKCCHDMDILLWLIDSPCVAISSFGERSYFREENAPEGAPKYCLDGCAHRETCPYYAPRFYLEHKRALFDNLTRAVSADVRAEAVLDKLKDGPYGRCVFHCDNTVVDHQTVNMKFENQVDVALNMCAFTKECKREIRLMGTMGEIIGDMEEGCIILHDFVSGNEERIKLNTSLEGHSGSDSAMMKDFVALIAADGRGERRTEASLSVESHLMALAAEQSRVEGRTVDFAKYKEESFDLCKKEEENA